MPTLLQINSVVNVSSTGRIAEDIGRTVIASGWKSYIAYGREKNLSQSTLIKIGTRFDQSIHVLQTRLLDRHGLGSKFATNVLINKISDIKPSIIHLHNIHGYYLNYKILFNFLRETNIPVVWTLHDCWSFTGHCTYYDFVNCDKWKTECKNCVQKNTYPSSLLLDRSIKNFTDKKKYFTNIENLYLVPVSNWLQKEVKKSFLDIKNISVIHNGIDLDIFKPKVSETELFTNKSIILGVASDWIQRKGFSDFLKLSKLISADFIIVMIGLKSEIIKKLPKNIIGIEKTNDLEDLVKYYSEALVFFNPTYEDNFPTTNLESLACGTPVITYNTGGSPEAIDKETGYVVDKGDVDSAFSKIQELKRKEKDNIDVKCRARAVKLFDRKNKFNEYYSLYNQILKKNAKK